MNRLRTSRRLQVLLVVIAIPILFIGALGVYAASVAGELPWQTDPTPIAGGITPFANLGGSTTTTPTPVP